MKFYFHKEAEADLDKAVEFYEGCRSGLGLEFAKEVYAAIALTCQYPDAWAPLSGNTRRCRVRRFPYGVIYRVNSGYVEIIAVADLRRAPSYRRDRL